MHKYFKAVFSAVLAAAIMLSFGVTVFAQEEKKESEIWFGAICRTVEDIESAKQAGASGVVLAGELDLAQAYKTANGEIYVIADAADINEAENLYAQMLELGGDAFENVLFRVKGSASKVIKWAESKNINPLLLGVYTGNIYFSALSFINRFSKYENAVAVQLQTGNQDGVILHDSVTFMFEKVGKDGTFSFENTAKSAKRTDTARSWDDLIARGYSAIITAYPQDFAEYLKENTAEYNKLTESVNNAKSIDIATAFPNRVSAYESALEAAEALLADGSCAIYEMADARAVLDEAVANLNIDDGKKVQGDFEITPGRAAWALFGVALVLSWQIYFRKKWGKKA